MNWVSIGSDNGLLPVRHQAIIQTSAGLFSIGPLGANFSEILIKIQNFSFTKMHMKISSAKRQPFCPGETSSVLDSWWCNLHPTFMTTIDLTASVTNQYCIVVNWIMGNINYCFEKKVFEVSFLIDSDIPEWKDKSGYSICININSIWYQQASHSLS